MKIAVMQPYLFPYIGYFQLIQAVDVFVFYDDVNFIKQGWINRNKLLVNGIESVFYIELSKASSFKKINEVNVLEGTKSYNQLLNTLKYNYKKAPYFNEVYNLVNNILTIPHNSIADLAINSVTIIADYLSMDITFKKSSVDFHETRGLEKSDRLIQIAKLSNSVDYVNPLGGMELYEKSYFAERGVNLHFVKTEIVPYKQFNNQSSIGLSIIDVLMFNSKHEIKQMLSNFELI